MDATPDELKKAFRRLARECHPDHHPGVETHERFIEVTKAYRVLGDPERRREYDGEAGLTESLPPPEAPEGVDPYEVLGIDENAKPEQIRDAFRRLNLELRPAARRGEADSAERFRQILDAYRILGDPERRRHWDVRSRSAA